MADLRALPELIERFVKKENLIPKGNGRYFATPALAEKLKLFLWAEGFHKVKVRVTRSYEFDVYIEV